MDAGEDPFEFCGPELDGPPELTPGLVAAVFRRVLEWLVGVYRVEGEAPRLVVATPPGQANSALP